MPEPLVMPATRTLPSENCTSSEAVLGRVSVVMIASATAWKLSPDNRSTNFGSGAMRRSAASSTPMTPVEAGTMYSGRVFNVLARALQDASATRSAVRVAQFALPALIRTAVTLPREILRCWRASFTGAACTTLLVNTAAP
jgi:hypothetical protein